MMAALERNREQSVDLNPHSGLGMVAEQTAAFWFEHQRLPAGAGEGGRRSSQLLHAQLRAIERRVRRTLPGNRRQGEAARARGAASKGYFAVRAPAGAPVLSIEAPALRGSIRHPCRTRSRCGPQRCAFPSRSTAGLTPIVVEVPTSSLTFQAVPDGSNKYRADATVLVRFSNDSGDVIDKMSRHYELTGPMTELDGARTAKSSFTGSRGIARGHLHAWRLSSMTPSRRRRPFDFRRWRSRPLTSRVCG